MVLSYVRKLDKIAEQLGYHTTENDDSDDLGSDTGSKKFKASNGWLDRWKRRYNIRQITVSGNSGDVSGVTVDSWKEGLPELVRGYKSVSLQRKGRVVVEVKKRSRG